MTGNVQVVLTGCQIDEAGEETITESRTAAECHEKNGGFYLLYEEDPEGVETPVRNIIKLKGSILELTKRGAINARMVFEAGKEHVTDYITPYGRLRMEVFTRAVKTSFQGKEMTIRAEYTLSSDNRLISSCVLTIRVSPLS